MAVERLCHHIKKSGSVLAEEEQRIALAHGAR